MMVRQEPQKETITEEQMNEVMKEAQRVKKENEYRIMSIAHMEAAMRCRYGFYLNDIENFEASAIAMMEADPTYIKANHAKRAKIKAKVMNEVLSYNQKTENVNKVVDAEIKTLTSAFTEKSHDKFDNYVATFIEVAAELYKAKNTADFLKVCLLFNMGIFDKALEDIRKIENQESQPPKTTEDETKRETIDELTARYNNAGLQEGSHLSIVPGDTPEAGTSDSEHPNSGISPDGNVHNDISERPHGDEPGNTPGVDV